MLQEILLMCIVQHVKMKNVFTLQPKKRSVSTTVKSAKPAATFWIFLSRTKNRQICCLAAMAHLALSKERIVTTKKGNRLHFWRNFSVNPKQGHPNLNQKKRRNYSIYGVFVSTPHWMIELTKTSNTFSLYTLSFYIKARWSSQSPTTVLRVSRLWTRFSDSDCERFRPRNDNKLPRTSSGS